MPASCFSGVGKCVFIICSELSFTYFKYFILLIPQGDRKGEKAGLLFYEYIFIHFLCSQRSQITLGLVSSAVYKQEHSSPEEGFCPNKKTYNIMTYQKKFVFDFNNIAGYIVAYTSPTFPTSTCDL